jgi:hypothetical protein
VLYALSYATGGAMAALTAVEEPSRRRLGLDLLMILAPTGAAVLGDRDEGAVLLSLFSLSGTLEASALYGTTRSIDALIKLRPRETTRVRDVQAEKTAAQLFVELWRGLSVAGAPRRRIRLRRLRLPAPPGFSVVCTSRQPLGRRGRRDAVPKSNYYTARRELGTLSRNAS